MTFGKLNGSRKEGFDKLKKGDYVKFYDPTGSFFAKILRRNSEGFEVEMTTKSGLTGLPENRVGFFPYRSITGFSMSTEAEFRNFLENEPEFRRYLDQYVRLYNSGGELGAGRLESLSNNGVYLCPYLNQGINEEFGIIEGKKLFIAYSEIKRIRPTSLEEITDFINFVNQKIKEAREKKEAK